ncbi:hypothetical protein Trydic_g22114 [Trypoxylus dichotomus]
MRETGKSRLAQHAWVEDHRILWNNAVLDKEGNATKRKLLETAYMAITSIAIGVSSLEIKNVWPPTIRGSISRRLTTTIRKADERTNPAE